MPFSAQQQQNLAPGQNGNQWVGDFQNSAPFRPGQQTYEKDINVEDDEDEDDEEVVAPKQMHYTGNFRPSGQPGVLHYQKQPVSSHAEGRKKDAPTKFLTKYDHRNSIEDINEERVI